MRTVFINSVFILLTVSSRLLAQTNSQQILLIDKKVTEIQTHLNSFERIEKIKNSMGYKIIYLKNNCLQKVEVCFVEESIQKKIEWFFNDNNMIYIEKNWAQIESGKITEHEKFYTNEKQLLAWFDKNNYLIDCNNQEYQQVCEQLIVYGKNLLQKNQD